MNHLQHIIAKPNLDKKDLIQLLSVSTIDDVEYLYKYAREIRDQYCGNKVFFRGLIEVSNICKKNCLYCGIRNGNKKVLRYDIPENEVIETAKTAWDSGLAAIVLQSGERTDKVYINKITHILEAISLYTNRGMRVTLSFGEQQKETYKTWKKAGADAYLLRIESSNPELFRKIHPDNHLHRIEDRIKAIKYIKDTGFQLGTGVMIGLPFQTIENLAEDLLFLQKMDVDMVGMGPYLEHEKTPMYEYRNQLLSEMERQSLTLKMYACLRILMKDINIASTTALEAISSDGRLKGIAAGANVVMPNITPLNYMGNYNLYHHKSVNRNNFEKILYKSKLDIYKTGCHPILKERGDPIHFNKKNNTQP